MDAGSSSSGVSCSELAKSAPPTQFDGVSCLVPIDRNDALRWTVGNAVDVGLSLSDALVLVDVSESELEPLQAEFDRTKRLVIGTWICWALCYFSLPILALWKSQLRHDREKVAAERQNYSNAIMNDISIGKVGKKQTVSGEIVNQHSKRGEGESDDFVMGGGDEYDSATDTKSN